MDFKKILTLLVVNFAPFCLCIAMSHMPERQTLPRASTPVIEEEVFTPNHSLSIVHGTHAEQGDYRPKMEDYNFPDNESSSLISNGINFFGVYDGHGGIQAAKFSYNFLHQNVIRECGMRSLSELAIVKGHQITDASFIKNVPRNESGTTTVTALFEETTLWIANAGDSEAVACFDGTNALCITQCHKPDQEHELTRITSQKGGTVRIFKEDSVQIITVQRTFFPPEANNPAVLARNRTKQVNKFLASYDLDGKETVTDKFFTLAQIQHDGYNLSISRGIGDFYSKPFCIPDPFIQSFQITQPGFIILASDGLWDTISYQAAVNFVLKKLRDRELSIGQATSDDAHDIAHQLVQKALAIWDHDNVTVTIVFFSPIE